MKRKQMLISAVVLGVLLALAAGLSQAQGPEPPEGEVQPQSEAAAAAVWNAIPVQGRLTDDSGNPINGTRTITFTLYDQYLGGAILCQDDDDVEIANGLFNANMNFCTSSDINGRALYLGIKVEDDDEMTDRQPIYPVPYAFSLRPGAVISDTRDGILTVRSTGSGDDDALFARADGWGEAVTAHARDGTGIWVTSDTNLGLNAHSYETSDHPGVYGCSASDRSTCDDHKDDSGGAGVSGYGSPGVFGQGTWGYGVLGKAGAFGAGVKGEGNLLAYAGWFTNTDMTVLYITSGKEDSDNAIVVDGGADNEDDFRVTNAGTAYADGGWQGNADFAELIETEDDPAAYEPGDVLVISTESDRAVALSSEPYATAVIGVYSENPGFVGSAHVMDGQQEDEIPVGITGIVPCKVSAENGAIQRGDLLVTAATPGHAMRAGDNPPQGTVLGKALGELEEGTGVIEILVTLQ